MPIDEVFRNAIEVGRAVGRRGLSDGSLLEFREALDDKERSLGNGPDVEQVLLHRIPTRAGIIEGFLYRPTNTPEGIVIYIHGGGWVGGSRHGFDQLCRRLAVLSGYSLLFVDYRLAPEHRFPAGLEDVEDAIQWASENRDILCSSGAEIVLAGDSAGANLSAIASRSLRNRVSIIRQVLFYPVTDFDFDTPSYRVHGEGLNMTRRDMQWFFENYAPSKDWSDPRISPLRASLDGTPPTWIGLAEYDVLQSEGESYARQLERLGIPVRVQTYAGAVHGFARWFCHSEIARDATIDAAAAITGRIHSPSPGSFNSLK